MINSSEREHHLQIHTPIGGLRIEYASGQCDGLAEKAGAKVPDGRPRINVVQHVARIRAESKAIAVIVAARLRAPEAT